jgi:hypothetical protein
MKAFGIELRRSGNVQSLYQDVDQVLSRSQVPAHGITKEIQVQTVAHALQKMIDAGSTYSYFDVCTIDNCAKLCSLCISNERYKVYRAAHCLRWNEMTPEYRQLLLAMVLDDFRSILNPTITESNIIPALP